jgi:hypothetical protein
VRLSTEGATSHITAQEHKASETNLHGGSVCTNTRKLSCEFIGKRQDILTHIAHGNFQVNHKG